MNKKGEQLIERVTLMENVFTGPKESTINELRKIDKFVIRKKL